MNQHRFVWHDLNTKDVEASQKFYGEVFGWKFDKSDNGPYIHITAGTEMIGGVRAMGPDEHGPTSWLGYITVADVDASVAAAKAAGGRVYMPTMKMENVGTFAVLADPTGAAFAPWTSARPEEDAERDTPPGPYTFRWDELVSTDPKAAATFYARVFGWEPREMPMGPGGVYTLLDRPGTKSFSPAGGPRSAGGIMKSPPGVPYSFWLPYVIVEDVDRHSERATKLGGSVMVPPQDIPNVGRFACWSDPQNASIAVLHPRMG